MSCYGNADVSTPHQDALAESGARCTDLYAWPVCTPSRAMLLTGRYPHRSGTEKILIETDNPARDYMGVGLNQDEIILPQLLKEKGYRTACFGKWHLGFAEGSRPTERGFDEFFGHASGQIDYFKFSAKGGKPDLYRGTEPVEAQGYSTDVFADAAIEFMRRESEAPFFVYLPFNAPHSSHGPQMLVQAPQPYLDRYQDVEDEQRRHYLAGLSAMDDAIGRIVAQLKAANLEEDTLVIFFSDNGGDLAKGASNGKLRGEKATLAEGGIRVPGMVRWPGQIASNSVCREVVSEMDFFNLCLDAAQSAPPPGKVIDGRDPLPVLTGKAKSPHPALYFDYQGQWAIRRGQYKLVTTDLVSNSKEPMVSGLFDVVADPGETKDLSAQMPQLVEQLTNDYGQWKQSLG